MNPKLLTRAPSMKTIVSLIFALMLTTITVAALFAGAKGAFMVLCFFATIIVVSVICEAGGME